LRLTVARIPRTLYAAAWPCGRRLPDDFPYARPEEVAGQWDQVASTLAEHFSKAGTLMASPRRRSDMHDEWQAAERRYFAESSMVNLFLPSTNVGCVALAIGKIWAG
jgi:hypothetical protein